MSSRKPSNVEEKTDKKPVIPGFTVLLTDAVNMAAERPVFTKRWEKTGKVAKVLDVPNGWIAEEKSGTVYKRAFLRFEKACKAHDEEIYKKVSALRGHVEDLVRLIKGLAEDSTQRLAILQAWLKDMVEQYGFLESYVIPCPWLNYKPVPVTVRV